MICISFKASTGEFRHPIVIERYSTDKKDVDGIPCSEWECLFKTKAKITNLKFEELLIAQGEGLNEIKNFYIRKSQLFGITRKDRIAFNGNYYNIKSIDDIQNKGRYLQIKGELIE